MKTISFSGECPECRRKFAWEIKYDEDSIESPFPFLRLDSDAEGRRVLTEQAHGAFLETMCAKEHTSFDNLEGVVILEAK